MSTSWHDPQLQVLAYSVADEMVKQAFLGRVAQGVANFGKGQLNNFKQLGQVAAQRGANPKNWVTGGWDLMKGAPHAATSAGAQGWVGSGNITRHLPIGPKSILAIQTGLGAKSALSAEDPTGMGRSRKERLGELAGRTIAGVGATLPANVGFLPSVLAQQVASSIGGRIGAKAGRMLDKKPNPNAPMDIPRGQ
jgi:hypothetical protein